MSTREYPAEARERLARAHTRAREAAGYTSRPKYAAAVPDVGLRSIVKLEQAEPVGQLVLEAVGRVLPNWTEDTPKTILEGGPIPPTAQEGVPDVPRQTTDHADDEITDDEQRLIDALVLLKVEPAVIAQRVREHRARIDQKRTESAIRQASESDTK